MSKFMATAPEEVVGYNYFKLLKGGFAKSVIQQYMGDVASKGIPADRVVRLKQMAESLKVLSDEIYKIYEEAYSKDAGKKM
jgi:hypothetical protein